jgi:hypothetical protein
VSSIFPFWVDGTSNKNGYVELPYTLPQDFTLFVLMKETDIDIWKQKLSWIAKNGGMALLNTHPDYMTFNGTKIKGEQYPAKHYRTLLEHIKRRYEGLYWHVLPRQIARHFSSQRIHV